MSNHEFSLRLNREMTDAVGANLGYGTGPGQARAPTRDAPRAGMGAPAVDNSTGPTPSPHRLTQPLASAGIAAVTIPPEDPHANLDANRHLP